MEEAEVRVLLVCLGNICRSPMAEGILSAKLEGLGRLGRYHIESAGTGGWHAGERPDPRTLAVLHRHGADCRSRARQVEPADFEHFDWILAMDRSNLRDLQRVCPPSRRDHLFLALEPAGGTDVPDPYYGGPEGFEQVYRLLDEALGLWITRWEGRSAGRG